MTKPEAMKTLHYQIVRYIHDQVTGEFVNIGVIVYQPELQFLQAKFINRFSRITQFFNNVNGNHLLSTLRLFNQKLNLESERLSELFSDHRSLVEITSSILPKDDRALVCSELMYGIDLSPDAFLEDNYERLIAKYFDSPKADQRDDSWVWKKVYKEHFDRVGLSGKLTPHTISTETDHIEFDKAWKNGVWNIYQTLSFDLKRTDAIKNKVYRWSGILNEIEKTQEDFNLYFLTSGQNRHKNLNKFIQNTLLDERYKHLNVTLVVEKEASEFAQKVKKEIEAHIGSSDDV